MRIRVGEKHETTGRFMVTHGLEDTAEYRAWANAIYRCENRNAQQWPIYGAVGVKVCDRWRNSFEAFLDDMGPRPSSAHSLDRFPNPDGDYEPGNCRWATPAEQANNRRNTPRIAGMSPMQLSAATGLPYTTIKNRLQRGWSHERILSQPRQNYPEHRAC
jgi:hypothetical protein